MPRADIALCWVNVHGGRYHALLHLRERLRREGLSCDVLLNSDAPLGLQKDLDVTAAERELLEGAGARVLPLAGMARAIREERPRLCLFDAHAGSEVPELLDVARAAGALTAQTSTLFADYSYHGADYVLIEHPLCLWMTLDYSRERGAADIAKARGVFFSGNIFYEPLVNVWTSDVRTRADLAAKYGLDPARPMALWLPNREDGQSPEYGRIIAQARAAGFGVLVKLHPWEYKQLRHGFDPYGQGMTSAQKWGVPAMDERDTSWALKFCDVGLMRGSSLGLELPFWEKPGVIFPCPGLHAGWYHLLALLTADTARHLDSVEGLEALLRAHWPFGITAGDYASARRAIMPAGSGGPGEPDSLDLHARHLRAILENRAEDFAADPGGSLSALRRLYEPAVPPDFYRVLRPWQRILHAFRRATGMS